MANLDMKPNSYHPGIPAKWNRLRALPNRPQPLPETESAGMPPGDRARPAAPKPRLPIPWLCALLMAAPGFVFGGTNDFFSRPLSLAEAINLALEQNPAILRARKDIEAAEGIRLQFRAVAMPKVAISGAYDAAEPGDVDTLRAPGDITFGNDQKWNTQIKLVQSLYEGGRLSASWRSARLTRERAVLNCGTTVASTILDVQLAYYDVLLAEQQIRVQEASVELLSRELADTTKRFEAGTVPRFNVLRAEVELANAQPRLIRVRSAARIARNNLANLLGVNIPKDLLEDIPINLSDRLEAAPYAPNLSRGIATALENRTELAALRKSLALRKEEVVNAKSGYKPSLQAFAGYDAHNSLLSSDLTDELHGWIAGAQVTWNLFDGLQTRGRVLEARANFERAEVDVDDAARRIELEVRTAYAEFITAREVLESQKKVLEQAEEALRLANARYEAGTGTQLDVLGSQTSLTDARTTNAQALHGYAAARARLDRAIGLTVEHQPSKP